MRRWDEILLVAKNNNRSFLATLFFKWYITVAVSGAAHNRTLTTEQMWYDMSSSTAQRHASRITHHRRCTARMHSGHSATHHRRCTARIHSGPCPDVRVVYAQSVQCNTWSRVKALRHATIATSTTNIVGGNAPSSPSPPTPTILAGVVVTSRRV